MNKEQKERVLEILEYWKTIEFLEQNDIPKVLDDRQENPISNSNTKNVVKEFSLKVKLEKQMKGDMERYPSFPETSERIGFIFGKIERNAYATYIEKFLKERPNNPEKPYPKTSSFGWFSFSTDLKGIYQKGTFQLSPLLWSLSVWEKNNADINYDFHLDTEEYEGYIKKKDEELEEKNITEFLIDVYRDVKGAFVPSELLDTHIEEGGVYLYRRYIDEKVKKKEEDGEELDLADLGRSFFLKDINLLHDLISKDQFGLSSDYEKKVIDYILSAYSKSRDELPVTRTNISPKANLDDMRKFFDVILDINKAPKGKWPAKFMPALMQQVAVNLAIQKGEAEIPVFSVNGPPGTGKTTLLKEIVANNVVERAKLLARYADDPDMAFEEKFFSLGPLEERNHAYYKFAPSYYSLKDDEINRYGMLVASCNNAAVENITIDLPKANDILDNLKTSDNDSEDVQNGLREVKKLFDIEETDDVETFTKYGENFQEKDIYFTRYANELLGMSGCWGLISAPFGKKSNLRKYCDNVLKPFIDEYKSNKSRNYHKGKFKDAVKLFNKQLHVVETMAGEIHQLIECTKDRQFSATEEIAAKKKKVEFIIKQLDEEIFDKQKKLIELEESWFKKVFGFCSRASTRNEIIAELKSQVINLERKKHEQQSVYNNILKSLEFNKIRVKYSSGENKMSVIDAHFMDSYASYDEEVSTIAQVTNPWFTPKYNREREKLFLYACKLHKEFCLSAKAVWRNIVNLQIAWNMSDDCSERMKTIDREAAIPSLLQTIFLLTPVISTTFASAQTFLKDVKKSGSLGMLIVDEAGQAQPQMAIGAMIRCRKAIIVGDPKQIEPVVTAEVDCIKKIMSGKLLSVYKDKTLSVQGFADYINPYGTFLGEDDEREWVGCPLVVHRRCIDPMYTISNFLSYDGTMKQQTQKPKQEKEATFILEKSAWIQVIGSEIGEKDHFVKEQGEIVLKLLSRKIDKTTDRLSLFIITPFTSVKNGMIDMLKSSMLIKDNRIKKWMDDDNIGTVHTFQGKGTDEVIFLLGCDQKSKGAANWVNKNIVNVAATRAKYRLYIIGDEKVWTCKPVRMARELTKNTISEDQLAILLMADSTLSAENMVKPTDNSEGDGNIGHGNCPICGSPLILRKRQRDNAVFLGCTGFPKCRYTESVKY